MTFIEPVKTKEPASKGLAIFHRCGACGGELLAVVPPGGKAGTWHACACQPVAWRFAEGQRVLQLPLITQATPDTRRTPCPPLRPEAVATDKRAAAWRTPAVTAEVLRLLERAAEAVPAIRRRPGPHQSALEYGITMRWRNLGLFDDPPADIRLGTQALAAWRSDVFDGWRPAAGVLRNLVDAGCLRVVQQHVPGESVRSYALPASLDRLLVGLAHERLELGLDDADPELASAEIILVFG